jgi:hypothetical protein
LKKDNLLEALCDLDDDFEQIEGYDVVADGVYWAVVEDVSLDLPDSSTNPRIVWRLRILHSDYFDRQLRRTLVVTRNSLRWLKRDLYHCGVALESLQDLPGRLDSLLNLKILVKKDAGTVHILRVDLPVTAQGHLFLHLMDGTDKEYLDQQLLPRQHPRNQQEFEVMIDHFVNRYQCPRPDTAYLEDSKTGEILFRMEHSKKGRSA